MASDQTSEQAECGITAELQEQPEGALKLVLRGHLDVQNTGACWRDLERRLRSRRVSALEVDARRLELKGGIGIALLRILSDGGMTPEAKVRLTGLHNGARKLLDAFSGQDVRGLKSPHQLGDVVLPELGAAARAIARDLFAQVEFAGKVARVFPIALIRPKFMRWGEVKRVMETAGANALPLVCTVSWLVGLVMALESMRAAREVKQYPAGAIFGRPPAPARSVETPGK